MKTIRNTITFGILLCVLVVLQACEDFVMVNVPDHKITSETVFANDETARSAMNGIYNQLFNAGFSDGGNRSVTFLAGLSADNFKVMATTNEIQQFGENSINTSNSWNLDLWSGAYNMVYMTNAVLEGIANSATLSADTKQALEGEAKFVRAFTYFYLTNCYGKVPLLLNTSYQQNAVASRNETQEVYDRIIADLEDAAQRLPETYPDGDRTRPTAYTAMALLARVYLYLGDWQQAAAYSTEVIEQTSVYELLSNPNTVFLANSKEAIWQISPIGWGSSFTHTHEGNLFIYTTTINSPVALSDSFMGQWKDTTDLRYVNWVHKFSKEEQTVYYPYKYKIQYDASGGNSKEYSMVMRLAEVYLIRAEARVHMNDISGAVADIDQLRKRAEVALLTHTNPNASQQELLALILQERRKELFAEWGHRWFDVRRSGDSSPFADKEETSWQNTDFWFPIPEEERMKNPNLTQNENY
ncbi:RagB/SusD family nutrient uptake outer membrane protein [Zhouia sp. PK063]|uniref:RagB/SusD family nutrient uptake outer membrane protein n=1 Tax=Zhouia sp. PK063 TaxID=3373602 RepID=UPI0037B2E5B2